MDYYKSSTGNDIPIIDHTPDGMALAFSKKDGAGNHIGSTSTGYGYVPRDYSIYPEEMFAPPSEIVLIPDSEMDARWQEQEDLKSSLEHIYLSGPGGAPRFECLDQNGHGYCWSYSSGSALMLARLRDNQPLIRLNPHSTAAIIKGGKDEGGWCGLSAKFVRENGMAEEGTAPGQWPLHSRNLQYDTPACRASMKKYLVIEDFVDLTRQVYDQNLTMAQLTSCLFANLPCPTDYNWWGHSVCALRRVRIEAGDWGTLILNSWKGWGRHGLGVLRGTQAIVNGAVCARAVTAAA